MIKRISSRITDYIVSKRAIDGNRKDVVEYYSYGIEITVSSIINILLIVIASVVLTSIPEGIIFMLVFIPTRQFVGGYHAESYLSCNITFLSSYVTTVILFKNFYRFIPNKISLIILIFEVTIFVIVAPISNRHKPIRDKKQLLTCKIIGSSLFLFWGMIGIMIKDFWTHRNGMVLFTLHLIAVLGVIGILKERRSSNNEEKQ